VSIKGVDGSVEMPLLGIGTWQLLGSLKHGQKLDKYNEILMNVALQLGNQRI